MVDSAHAPYHGKCGSTRGLEGSKAHLRGGKQVRPSFPGEGGEWGRVPCLSWRATARGSETGRGRVA